MPERGTRRYTLKGPCVSWALQGRDGLWYRVCVPCDTVIPAGGRLPRHLAHGYRRESDAWMSVRGHMRDMAANRLLHLRAVERQRRLIAAATVQDYLLFGQLITGDPAWAPKKPCPRDEQLRVMADYLGRTGH